MGELYSSVSQQKVHRLCVAADHGFARSLRSLIALAKRFPAYFPTHNPYLHSGFSMDDTSDCYAFITQSGFINSFRFEADTSDVITSFKPYERTGLFSCGSLRSVAKLHRFVIVRLFIRTSTTLHRSPAYLFTTSL